MRIWTDAIGADGYFDPRYTCDLDNSSPELRWDEFPEDARSFALIAEDLDHANGPFSQWVIYTIPADIHHLPTGIPPQDSLPNGIRQGLNGFGKLGYAGPCPPKPAQQHRYRFTLYALNQQFSMPSRLTRETLLDRIQPHVIATCSIEGLYQRTLEQRAG